jgi:hypothetical protein
MTPGIELGDHLRARIMSALLLIVASLLAILVSFANPHLALWSFMLAFAGPLLRQWGHPRVLAD